jgi:hypothetical protein
MFAAQATQVWTGSNLDRYKHLTPWSRIILEKIIVSWPVNKFPEFYGA